jgi:TM2 domain-containing membrane protein YozV
MKSKTVAYLLWFFLGFFGIHKFYLGKVGIGILYFFTFGIFGIGWFIDLFTLGTQVDVYNALRYGGRHAANSNVNQNNVHVNVSQPTPEKSPANNIAEQITKLSELKEKGHLTEDEFNTQKAKILA